jgi:predicted outer membrane repeat protein
VEAEDNEADVSGGAIWSSGTLEITRSVFFRNRADVDGGAIFLAITGTSKTSTIEDTLFDENGADVNGGAIHNAALSVLNVRASTLRDGNVQVSGDSGGAIYNLGTLRVDNSTFGGNEAQTNGGAIHNSTGTTDLRNVTFGPDGGNQIPGASIFAAGGTIRYTNTIFSAAVSSGATVCGKLPAGTLTSLGHNLLDEDVPNPSSDCPLIGSDIIGDPDLDSDFRDNGGPTETLALGPDSEAIDAGDDEVCEDIGNVDQTGFERPSGAHCDIGSVEFDCGGDEDCT